MASNFVNARAAEQVAVPAITLNQDVTEAPASTLTVITNGEGRRLLFVIEQGGVAFAIQAGDHSGGGMPTDAPVFPGATLFVFSAPSVVTILPGAASTVRAWWAD